MLEGLQSTSSKGDLDLATTVQKHNQKVQKVDRTNDPTFALDKPTDIKVIVVVEIV